LRLYGGGRRPWPWPWAGALVLFIFVGFFANAWQTFQPAFWALAEMEARTKTTEIMNKAVLLHIAKEPVQMIIERDNQGRVTLVQPNVRSITALSAGTSLAVKEELRGLSGNSIEIPLGLLSGSYFLAAWGPRIRVRLLWVGAMEMDVFETFESVGINQTRHVVVLKMATKMRIVAPLSTKDISVEASFPVSEIVFSGEVPNVWGLPR